MRRAAYPVSHCARHGASSREARCGCVPPDFRRVACAAVRRRAFGGRGRPARTRPSRPGRVRPARGRSRRVGRGAAGRGFLEESITCYKAGAYRACVVSTWIALVYDFIEKFRELSLAGDTKAKKLVQEFERIQQARDVTAALKFEREMLDIAKDSYEFISPQEHTELKRLFEDRNRFGHPNLNHAAEVLRATPELARSHLRAAVEHVMSRPPVQGKAALSAIQAAVDSPYFPRVIDDAVVALSSTPLKRAKSGAVRDFFLGAVRSLFAEKLDVEAFERRLVAAQACQQMHREVVDLVIRERMEDLLDRTDDAHLGYLIVGVVKFDSLRKKISAALKLRLEAYIRQLKTAELPVLNFASELDFLAQSVQGRLETVTSSELRDFVQRAARAPSRPVIEKALVLLENSKSWDSSNAVCAVLAERMLPGLTEDDSKRVLASAANGEVKWAFSYPALVEKILDLGLINKAQISDVVNGDKDHPLRHLIS